MKVVFASLKELRIEFEPNMLTLLKRFAANGGLRAHLKISSHLGRRCIPFG
jgi:hypothetical protein